MRLEDQLGSATQSFTLATHSNFVEMRVVSGLELAKQARWYLFGELLEILNQMHLIEVAQSIRNVRP